jgi:uncharacterized membrane protein YjjB (DUF3815 family)
VACGVVSHTLRTVLLQFDVEIITGTLIGALAAGFLAQAVARRCQAPPPTFLFPGIVAMVPGAYAFRAVLGGLQIAHGVADTGVIADTLSLGLIVMLMTAAIAVGAGLPALLSGTLRAARGGSRAAALSPSSADRKRPE